MGGGIEIRDQPHIRGGFRFKYLDEQVVLASAGAPVQAAQRVAADVGAGGIGVDRLSG
jgi:hypothetical protein